MFFNRAVRGAIGKGAGDSVEIRIRLDRSDRMPETPSNLWEALAGDGASAAWEALARRGGRNSLCGWRTLSGTRPVTLALAALCRPLSKRARPVWGDPAPPSATP